MNGVPTLEYNLNIFFRVNELWNFHDKGKAALHFFADAQGIWRTLVRSTAASCGGSASAGSGISRIPTRSTPAP